MYIYEIHSDIRHRNHQKHSNFEKSLISLYIWDDRQNFCLCARHQFVFKSFLCCRDHISLGNPERHEEPEEKAYDSTDILLMLVLRI